jgi:hypothetical protein
MRNEMKLLIPVYLASLFAFENGKLPERGSDRYG